MSFQPYRINLALIISASLVTTLHGILVFSIHQFGPEIGTFSVEPHSWRQVLVTFPGIFIYTLLFAAFLQKDDGPGKLVFYLYYLILMVPLVSCYAAGFRLASEHFIYLAFASFTIAWLVYKATPLIVIPTIDPRMLSGTIILSFAVSVFAYGYIIASGGLARLNFDLTLVYDVRAEASEGRSRILDYLIPWQGNVLNMFFLVYALRKRAWIGVGLVYAAQVLLFGMTNFKSILLAPVLVTGMFFMKDFRAIFSKLSFATVATVAGAALVFIITTNVMVPSLFIRRLFLVPATNHFLYYDFFSKPENPFVKLSATTLSAFFDYPYHMPVTRLISWTYSGREGGPNAGYLADGYANFGFGGMILFSIVLGIVCKLTDSASRSLPSNIGAAILAIPAMALVNSAFLTCLVTHGFLVAVIFIWILSSSHQLPFPRSFKQQGCRPVQGTEANLS